jgi:two-component system nitrogen regulation sensor histidine kinase NtrY
MIDATDQVSSGNFYVQVPIRRSEGDLAHLGETFNKMTAELRRQRDGLVTASEVIDRRRRFTETVLSGVSSGVVGLDGDGHITIINRSAEGLLGTGGRVFGEPIAQVAPEIAAFVGDALHGRQRQSAGQVAITRAGRDRMVNVRAVREGEGAGAGLVVTLDDITDLVLAQRTAAWADVARRIAHEIKNPLTPIQLATERLSRRYRKQIVQDPDLFEDLTRTIIRQVGDLRKMVDEFSSFARLPKPIFRQEDPVALTRQALFLQEVARPDIAFSFASSGEMPIIGCDRHQFGQAMTNVLKNAVEAVEAKAKEAGEGYRGRIEVTVAGHPDGVEVRISDNGIGLPHDRDRIIEPYVTTREKGTGLGLAIVNKIVEEHGGEMTFTSAQGGGTTVMLRFAADPLALDRSSEAAE